MDSRIFASLAVGRRRVTRLTYEGQTVWLKDFDQPSASKWAGAQKAVARTTGLELLRPVPSAEGIPGAAHEIEAIRRFRAIGIRVPAVLWSEGGRVALTDIGETLRDIERHRGQAAIGRIAASAASDLHRIHRAGLVHGRPILRNLTWDGETVGFLDFEEHPLAVMSLRAAQARDVLLLLISVGRRSGEDLVRTAFEAYSSAELDPAVGAELQRVLRVARPVMATPKSLLSKLGNRDLLGIARMLSAIAR